MSVAVMEGQDQPDGFLGQFCGQYSPRRLETSHWGPTVGNLPETDDPELLILSLIRNTDTERWRDGLVHMMNSYINESLCRQAVHFLLSIVKEGEGVMSSQCSPGTSINVKNELSPRFIHFVDWQKVLEGLNFSLTGPDTARDVRLMDVATGDQTSLPCLQGCHVLLQSILDLHWEHLRMLLSLDDHDAKCLYETMSVFSKGYGIQRDTRPALDALFARYPDTMRALGFLQQLSNKKLYWQRPQTDQFNALSVVIQGLFKPSGVLETYL